MAQKKTSVSKILEPLLREFLSHQSTRLSFPTIVVQRRWFGFSVDAVQLSLLPPLGPFALTLAFICIPNANATAWKFSQTLIVVVKMDVSF